MTDLVPSTTQVRPSGPTDVRASRDLIRLENLISSNGLDLPPVDQADTPPRKTPIQQAMVWLRTFTMAERSFAVAVPVLLVSIIGAIIWSGRNGLSVITDQMANVGWATLFAGAVIAVSIAANRTLEGRTGSIAMLRRIGLRVQLTATAAVLLLGLSVTAAVLAHLAFGMSDGSDLRDAQFVALDQRLGFDWTAYISRLNKGAAFGNLLVTVDPLAPLLIAAPVLLLGVTYQRRRLAEFICTVTLATLAAILLLALAPTAGAYVHLQPNASLFANLNPDAGRPLAEMITAWHNNATDVTSGLAVPGRLIDPLNVSIALSVPGLQVALAVLVVYALRRMLLTGIAAAGLCLLIILSPLNEDGQYLSQLLVGGMIAVGCILFTQVLRIKRRKWSAPPARLRVEREADFLTWQKPAR
jgi:hypothetical protein